MDSWDKALAYGRRAEERMQSILDDKEASARMEAAVKEGNALLSFLGKRQPTPPKA